MARPFATMCTAAAVALALSTAGCDRDRGPATTGDATSDAARTRASELDLPAAGGTNTDRSNAAAPGAMGGTTGGDATIVAEVRDKLRSSGGAEANSIDVRSSDGIVVLTGRVSSEDTKENAEDLANDVDGVERVENRIVVAQAPGTGPQSR